MWGWTELIQSLNERIEENPTYVGMDRCDSLSKRPCGGKPHVCGDGPLKTNAEMVMERKTPRMWGWTGNPDCIQ